MSNPLYELYSGTYDITPERDQKIEKKLYAEWDKVQRMFGDGFIERLLELEDERDDKRFFHYYREGFKMGVRLMLEAFTPA